MKILVTYDFLATSSLLGKTLSNTLSFIQKILYPLNIEVIIDDGDFEEERFYDLINLREEDRKKFIVLDENILNEDSLEMLKEYVDKYDLLIAYELSIETRNIFDKQKIKYIDLWLSPIRFYDDLMFDFYSNVPKVQNNLKKYKINEELFFIQSKKISNQFKYFRLNKELVLEDNSFLLVGQLFEDRSVIKNGKALTLIDYKKRLKILSKSCNKIYFQKHPFMPLQDFKLYFDEFKDIKNIEYLENINIYELLSRTEIKKVIAISSSVLYEANFFGKDIEYLYKPVIEDKYITIYKEYFNTSFWINILDLNEKILNIELLNYDNFFRQKLDAFWGYKDFIEVNNHIEDKKFYRGLVEFYNLFEKLPKDKQYILYGYGSIGKLIFPLIKNNIKGIVDRSITENFLMIDGCSVRIFRVEELEKDDSVIISAFKYNYEIKKELLKYTENILMIDIK